MSRAPVLLALCLTYIVFAMLLNSVGTVILQVINHYQVTKESASMLEGFKDLPIAIVSFLVASFLPRLGFKRAMIVGLGVVMLACLAMPLVPSFLTTKLLFLCVGSSFALIKVSVYSTVGLIAHDKKEHASFMNSIEGLFMVGVLAGYWLFSAFIDSSGDVASTTWLNVYWLLAGLCAVNIGTLLCTKFDESEARGETKSLSGDFIAMLKLMTRPLVYVFVISAFLYVLIEQGIGSWLPTFNNEILHLPAAMSVQATSIFAACLAIGRLSAGAVLRKVNWYPALNACLLAMGALILLTLPLTHDLVQSDTMTWGTAPMAAFIFPIIGLFMAPIYPAINSVILSTLPKPQHAAMTGLIVIFSALGGTTGSMITGFTFAKFGGQTAFYLSLIPIAGILVALFLFKRESDRFGAREAAQVSLSDELATAELR